MTIHEIKVWVLDEIKLAQGAIVNNTEQLEKVKKALEEIQKHYKFVSTGKFEGIDPSYVKRVLNYLQVCDNTYRKSLEKFLSEAAGDEAAKAKLQELREKKKKMLESRMDTIKKRAQKKK
jgi:hypothetical protein